ncbi:hypothetical protein tinsulaeT_08060 [Thalassotalea insulae]|uniref:HEPN domain-containing protein n=1 Tax=Thalassotalea insulae TaxID=2056778 RepID=A0ABQ6GTI2_9GAMM|nr:DUF5677 domain-containing protein [Thalassotalea insulae]GLX77466.1 hypothetical protein tinsulaeT_08060 [Thalassotalea insulae]
MPSKTEFEKHGFLAVESLSVPQYVTSKYAPYLNIFLRLNEITWSLQYELNIPKPENDIAKAWSAVLYARTINFVQAAYMLSSIGMRVQAETQLRCALEPLFTLGALKNNPSLIKDYDLAERKDRLKHGRSFITYQKRQKPKDNTLIKQVSEQCDNQEAELITRLKAHRPDLFKENKHLIAIEKLLESHPELKVTTLSNIRKLRPDLFKDKGKTAIDKFSLPASLLANNAGLIDWYDLLYRWGSSSVHSDAKSLEDSHFVLGEDLLVEHIKNEPELEDLDEFINTLCAVFLYALEFIKEVLDANIPKEEIESIKTKLVKLGNTQNSTP